MNRTDELRTARIDNLVTPAELAQRHPVSSSVARHVTDSRRRIEKILNGEDARLLVIVGPCSIHDLDAAMEYATRLQALREKHQARLEIVMRTYFEKPRTVVGWKGLISDPDLNGSYRVNHGIELARKLLLQVNELGVPTATEFLDMVTGQFIADLISWGAIGARTTESQIHREMASALSCPVGFKNGTDGNTRIAVDAIRASRACRCRVNQVNRQCLNAFCQQHVDLVVLFGLVVLRVIHQQLYIWRRFGIFFNSLTYYRHKVIVILIDSHTNAGISSVRSRAE